MPDAADDLYVKLYDMSEKAVRLKQQPRFSACTFEMLVSLLVGRKRENNVQSPPMAMTPN